MVCGMWSERDGRKVEEEEARRGGRGKQGNEDMVERRKGRERGIRREKDRKRMKETEEEEEKREGKK